MATDKTKLTELGTAVGLFVEPDAPWPAPVEHLEIPGLPADCWQPIVLPATGTTHPDRHLLQRAISNGQAFRSRVLKGRRPDRLEWSAGHRNTWLSDIPRDLTVDGVWFIQAKYDSTCVLNTAPATLVDHLLLDDGAGTRDSWFEAVALDALQEYYRFVRGRAPDGDDLPGDVRDLDRAHRGALKVFMRATTPTAAEDDAYRALSRAVSLETALRWEHRLRASTPSQRTQMLFRMLRIAGGPYWLLGTKGTRPVQLAVADTRTWRERFALKRFTVRAANAGQPQVDWRASIADVVSGEAHQVEGLCEIRWSHGKLQGHPECKVQVTTPLAALPGYEPIDAPA
jgi:hypothetical protein